MQFRDVLMTASAGGGGAYVATNAEAAALFARMTSQPDGARKARIDTLIGSLKSAGVWTKLDALYVFAAHSQQAAKLNWVADQYNITDPGTTSPSFTTDQGFTGDGTSDYLDTGFNPTTASSPKYTQNSAHMGVWLGNDVNSNTQIDCGNTRSRICGRTSTTAFPLANATAGSSFTLSPATSVGHFCWSRPDSANVEASKDGTALATASTASAGMLSLPFYILAVASTGPAAGSFSTRQQRAMHFGSHLNSTERSALYNALQTFLG